MWTKLKERWRDTLQGWIEHYSPNGSVQTQMMTVFCTFILLLLLLINTYPVLAMRNVVFADKQQSMTATATVISSALAGLDVLTTENVEPVLDLLNVSESNHILVTDERKIVIYDTWGENQGTSLAAVFGDLSKVFGGLLVFDSRYDGDTFTSEVCAPVMAGGNIIGSVYLIEKDREQADMISGILHRMTVSSLAIGLVALLLSMGLSRALSSRIRDLAGAVKIVQEGDYTHTIVPRGSDEITELTREFNSMTETLRRNEQVRRQFVSDASHELKTPLASIRLLSDSILQSEHIDRETTMEFVEDIGACAERLQHMTEKLLDLSRMDSEAAVVRSYVNLSEIVLRSQPMLRPLADNRNVTMEFRVEEGVTVYAAEEDLYQIVFNLVENAIKYNVSGGRVEVTLEQMGQEARLTVGDTGIGIPQRDLPHIFSRFYRVDKARSREAGGSGLGLSIVRDAVILHGGHIEVAGREPCGTVFTVTFPIEQGAST